MHDITAQLLSFVLACCVGFIFPGANPLSRPESPVPEGVLLGLRTRLPLPHVGFVSWGSLPGNVFSLKHISCPLRLLPRVLPNPTLVFPFKASNFLRAFRTIPEASALGLILADSDEQTGKARLGRLIQSWNRFILTQLHQETQEQEGPQAYRGASSRSAGYRATVRRITLRPSNQKCVRLAPVH